MAGSIRLDARATRVLQRARRRAALLLVALACLALYVTTRLHVSTEVTHFLPAGEDAQAARVVEALGESAGARTALLSVHAGDALEASACVAAIGGTLRKNPRLGWVS